MKITPILEDYSAMELDASNSNVFLIQNFKDNKEGLLYFFNYLEDSIKPRIPLNDDLSSCDFVYNKNDFSFDYDHYGATGDNISVYFKAPPPHLFYGVGFYTNKPTNPQTYTIKKQGNFIDIVLDYKELQRKPLKEFLKILDNYHINNWKGKTYRLVRKSDNKVEVLINYYKVKGGYGLGFDLKIIED